jgi:TFIIF-interacting CTD phosphatase-like protein
MRCWYFDCLICRCAGKDFKPISSVITNVASGFEMKEKLIILDLDETLIYATESPLDYEPSFEVGHYYVYVRPFANEFIEYCCTEFRVAIWTSSNDIYAQSIVYNLFGSECQMEFVWSRNKCVQRFNPETHEYFFIKDLKKVKKQGYNLESIIMVDDSPEKLIRNYGNLVRVAPFFGNKTDEELLLLMGHLRELKDVDNIRTLEKRGWRSKQNG